MPADMASILLQSGDGQDYAKLIQLQRQQALAQSLMTQGQGNPGNAQFGGLRNAGNALLGAFLAKRGDQGMADFYNPASNQSQPPPQPSGQLSNGPASTPQAGPQMPPLSAQSGPTPQISNTPNQQSVAQAAPQGQTAQQGGSQPPDLATLPPMYQKIWNGIPHIPGVSAAAAVRGFMNDQAGYYKAYYDSVALTPDQKDVNGAYGQGTPDAQSALRGIVGKKTQTRGTPGGGIYDSATNTWNTLPNQQGIQNVQNADGSWRTQLNQGAPQAIAGAAMASQIPKSVLKPDTNWVWGKRLDGSMGYTPQASNEAVMSGNAGMANALIPNINPSATQAIESGGNPYAVSPAGARGPMQTMPGTLQSPGFGVQPAQNGTPQEQGRVGTDYLGAMQQKYGNPVLAHIAYNMGPTATDKWLAGGGDFAKLPQETQMYLGRIAVAQAVPQSGSQPQQPGLPELPPGAAAGAQAMASNAANNATGPNSDWVQTHNMSLDVPTRLNVLQNIIKLSQQGAMTGSPEWMNDARQTAAALSQALGRPVSANNPAALMGEIQKYMAQQGNRMAQAQGGTGSDKQLESVQHANPNDEMFPATLRRVVPWIMANETAIRAKANFLDAQPGSQDDPKSQIAASQAWRNMYTPRIAQFEMMNPQQQAGYLNDPKAFSDKADRQQFIQSAMKLHPYFAQGR